MNPFTFRLAEIDAPDYKRGDEEFTFDPDALVRDLTAGQLEAIESELPEDYGLVMMLAEAYGVQRARAMRTAMWVARRAAGIDERYADFDPHLMRAQLRSRPVGAADPPDRDSSTSSEVDGSEAGSSTSPPV